nr:EOG090X02Z1 [Lepidurus arcticus]
MDFLEYSDVSAEIKGSMAPGRLKLTDQAIVFKNAKTGKVEQLSSGDIEFVNWQRLAGAWGIRIFMKNGMLHRFGGFKDSDQEKLAKFFTLYYKKDLLEKELSVKGWNWGTAKFNGSVLSMDIGNNAAFEIPLSNVSQCTTGKNEVTLEFHQNDEAPVSLMEMRYYIPSSELSGDDPVDNFQKQVMQKASVISMTGDAWANFSEVQCLTPRGRYDMKVFGSFIQLHGKTFDYKIPTSSVLRLFLLPHRDGRQMYFVVSLDPPIKQGQTRYHFLVFLFNNDEEITVELLLSEEELKDKFEGKLEREMSGPTYEVMAKVLKCVVNRKITVPGDFLGQTGTPAVGCSYKAAAGTLYPLERGFIFVHKPPIHVRFEEISYVNFARSGGSTRYFEFEVETKTGVLHTFASIEKEEYSRLFDYVSNKKLRVKNVGKGDKPAYNEDFGNSDEEAAAPDAYLARVKAEAEEKDEYEDSGSDGESTDEDFKPGDEGSDVAEEYDSNVSSSDDEEAGSDDAKSVKKKKKDKDTPEKKEKKAPKEKPVKERKGRGKTKKEKDPDKPKRAASAFFIWLQETRPILKAKFPGLAMTEMAKKAGEEWKTVEDKSEWEAKAAEAKKEYEKNMQAYRAGEKPAASSSKAKASSQATPAKTGVKSKEYISSNDSSSDESSKKDKKKAKRKEFKSDSQEFKSDTEKTSNYCKNLI